MSCVVVGSIVGAVIGFALTIVGLIFGIFACVPAAPFEERDMAICVSFIVLTALGIVTAVTSILGACVGACIQTTCTE